MTTWRDKLRPASFRGVPFFVESAESELGRRVALHEYPQRDKPYAEDLGLATRRFPIEAFIIGDDYLDVVDRFIAAIETAGPGELVHPYRGKLRVVAERPSRIQESTGEGGMARISCAFVESGEAKFPSAAVDTAAQLVTRAATARSALHAAFAAAFTVAGYAAFVRDSAVSVVSSATTAIRVALGVVASISGTVDAVTAAVDELASGVASLVLLPSSLAASLSGSLASLYGSVARVLEVVGSVIDGTSTAEQLVASGGTLPAVKVLEANRGMQDFGADLQAISPITPQREQQAANQDALVQLVRTASIIELCVVLPEVPFDNAEQASAALTELVDQLDALADTASDELFVALIDLRAAVVVHLRDSAQRLAHLEQWTPAQTMPAVLVAHMIYGDATRGDEIASRNRVAHPGFVTGGQALEVLSV